MHLLPPSPDYWGGLGLSCVLHGMGLGWQRETKTVHRAQSPRLSPALLTLLYN